MIRPHREIHKSLILGREILRVILWPAVRNFVTAQPAHVPARVSGADRRDARVLLCKPPVLEDIAPAHCDLIKAQSA